MESIIVAVIGVIGVGVGAGVTAWLQRRKTEADADNSDADATEKLRATVMLLIAPLKARIEELEFQVGALCKENADLKSWADALVHQVISLGAEPVPMRPQAAVAATDEPKTGKRRGGK